MTLNPRISLSFNGHCEDAFKFYERCLNTRIVNMLTWGDSPMANEAPPGWAQKIMHATLEIGTTTIVGSDVAPPHYRQPQGFEILLGVDDPGESERLFQALAENGIVHMPIQETFWSVRFGVLVDRFGVRWSINCEKSPEPGG